MIHGSGAVGFLDWESNGAVRHSWVLSRQLKLRQAVYGKVPAMNLLLSTVAVALGLFVAASPARAAEIWGRSHLDKLAPQRRVLYLHCFRAFGIVLCLGGVLFAVDSVIFSKYHR
jgi:hypothetical protein